MRKLYWLVIAITITVAACTKIESTTIGSGLIPPVDGINTLDTTLEVTTANFFDPLSDSVRVYYSNDHVIGNITNDPVFGSTSATAYFELKPTSYKYYFTGGTTNLRADSAVLVLSYKGIYGDNTVAHNWEVKELTETMSDTTSYPVSKQFTTGNLLNDPAQPITIKTGMDSVKDSFESATNQVRIKLTSEVAQRFIQYDSAHQYATDSAFRESFKGFAVGPSGNGDNALIKVNLVDTNTKLAIYYRFKKADGGDTLLVSYFRFNAGSSVGKFSGSANHVTRNYTGSNVAAAIASPSTNTQNAFVQTSPGTYASVKIPGLAGLPNMIIHRAELLAFQDRDDANKDQIFTPPAFLLLSGYNSDLKVKVNVPNDFIIDQSGAINTITFGGYPSDKLVNGSVVQLYNFDISRYVQGVLSRKEPVIDLRLSAPSNDSLRYTPPYPNNTAGTTFSIPAAATNAVAIGRVRLGGGGLNSANPVRMRLHIIYSKI